MTTKTNYDSSENLENTDNNILTVNDLDKLGLNENTYKTLTIKEKKFISVPYDLIYENNDYKTIAVYSYFAIQRNLVNSVSFYLKDIVKWCGLKPNSHTGESNDRIYEIMEYLKNKKYIDYKETENKTKHSSLFTGYFNEDYVNEISHSKIDKGRTFAIIYIDEIEKILNNKNCKKRTTNYYTLLVLSYLRLKINTRKENHLTSYDSYLEAYAGYLKDMAEEINMDAQMFSNCIDVLFQLKIIYKERMPALRFKEKIRTNFTIICNYEKRSYGKLIGRGESYYRNEVENLKIIINKKYNKSKNINY